MGGCGGRRVELGGTFGGLVEGPRTGEPDTADENGGAALAGTN